MAMAIMVGRDSNESKKAQWFIDDWKQALLALDGTLDIRTWPDVGNANEIEAVLVWRHPLAELQHYPNLKCIISLAAGVDHVLADEKLPRQVPVVRVMDPYMANDIVQYVVVNVLNYIKRTQHWANSQKQHEWNKKPPFNFSEKTIGIMGLGFLGKKAALMLAQLGLKVIGWSSSPKNMEGVNSFTGKEQFQQFLTASDILICMLPLTSQTIDILNKKTFSHLPCGAYLINLGRGEHLVEADLLEALALGQLSGACLDVFRTEPLPKDHPFWAHPQIIVTPHIASVTNAKTAAPQVLENYRRAVTNKQLLNTVDIEKGY
jgi:glyoxylate/hydroxypyruvate reductase A